MATYTKLRDGSWGLRATQPLQTGQSITVTKKSGETKAETVGRVLWTGNGVTLATIAQGGSSRSSRSAGVRECGKRHGGRCCPTGGNCSSLGSGRSCGAECCDGY